MSNTIDMTKGRILPLLMRFSMPLMLTNILQQLYSLCDSLIVGRLLGIEAFAAIGMAAMVIMLPQNMFLGLSQGFEVVFAQMFGSGSIEGFHRSKIKAALVSLTGAAVAALLFTLFRHQLLDLIKTPQELRAYASDYLFVMFIGLPVTAIFNWAASSLRATGDSRTPLVALFFSCITNIILDFILIYVFPLGVMGAGLATVTAQLLSCFICFRVMVTHKPIFPAKAEIEVDGSLKRLLTLGFPPMLRDTVISIGGLFVQSVINTFGVALVAGMTAAGRYFSIMNMCGSALEGAVATFSAQNTGAGQNERNRQGVKAAALLAVGLSAITAVMTLIAAPELIRFILGEGDLEALRMGIYALRCMALFLPALYILCLYRAALQGMGDSVTPMLSGFAELIMRLVCVICLPGILGYTAACIADGMGWVVAAILLVGRYFFARMFWSKNS